ncbi:secondary thiamine-phosphate synthase enzyme YjbQ [Patescibacteria group bacterium]|nr:secondary thiamine-phosphate synthase enzyme YjbQ [Patescibacteria group bacterium]
MNKKFCVSSQNRYQLIDITPQVEKIVVESKVDNGLCLVFVPHSTAAVILTESEEGLKNDWLAVLKRLVSGFAFLHDRIDNNADSHILSGLLGQGKTLAIEKGKLIRGTWQQIFLVELDGPRKRSVIVALSRSH